MPTPTIHVLHVDGGILENANASNDTATASTTATTTGTTSGGGLSSNINFGPVLSNIGVTGIGNNGGGGGGLLPEPVQISSISRSLNTSNNNNSSASNTTPSSFAGASGALKAGGGDPSTSASGGKSLYAASPLSPPTVSGVGCAPLQEDEAVAAVTSKAGKLTISSVISNSNLGTRGKAHHPHNSSSVMTHKTQMQMALQRKMNNLNLKQMNGLKTMRVQGGSTPGEDYGLLAEGIAVRGQQNNASGSSATTTSTNGTGGCGVSATVSGSGSGAPVGGNPSGGKRLQLVLPDNASEYAMRMTTPIQQGGAGGGGIYGHLEPSPLSSPLSASYSPLLPTSGFSSPLVHPKYASGGSSETPNGSEGTTPPSTTLPSTSGSFIFEYYNGMDAMLMHEEGNSVRTSESCSPHVRLCGSRASCGPMWTNEDLTMLAMDTNRPTGTSDSSNGTASGKGTATTISDDDGGGFSRGNAVGNALTDTEGVKGVSIKGGGGDKMHASAAKKILKFRWNEDAGNAADGLQVHHVHPPTA